MSVREIAALLDISVASVSRALNNHPHVREELRAKVIAAAKTLGYMPTQSGRSLRAGVSRTVGFMIETHPTTEAHIDVFLMAIFDGVQSVMSLHNLNLVVLPCSANEDPVEYLRSVAERKLVDGMILSSTRPKDGRVGLLKRLKMPFITLGRTGLNPRHAWIDLDFEAFAEEATDRFYKRGHRRIALTVPSQPLNFGKITLEGYQKALAERNIAFDPSLVVKVLPDEESGYMACNSLLGRSDSPTAVILMHQALASGFYKSLKESGLNPGKDLSLVSLQDGRPEILSPQMTTYRFPTKEIGVALAQSLLSTIPAFSNFYASEELKRLWPFVLKSGESECDGPMLVPQSA